MNRPVLWLSVAAACVAADVSAQTSPELRSWGETAVQYLMTRQEHADWAAVKTDADAKAFIDLFWARRDPTPETTVNEVQKQFEARIAEADKRFAEGKIPGAQTERGLIYTLFGEPAQIEARTPPPAPVSEFGMAHFKRPVNMQKWIYRSEAAERVVGTKAFDIAFVFQDEKNPTVYELDGPSKISFESTVLVIAKSVLKRPGLTASAAEAARTIALRIVVVSDSKLAYDILRRGQEGENFADLARKYSTHSSAKTGGFLGRMPFGDLDDDFRLALAGKEPGTVVLVTRAPMFAVVKVLTDAEAEEK